MSEGVRKDVRKSHFLMKRFKSNDTGFGDEEDPTDMGLEEVNAIISVALEKMNCGGQQSVQLEGIRALRTLLGTSESAIGITVSSGIVPLLSNFLVIPSHDIQLEAAWCLTNVASSSESDHVMSVLVAVPYLLQLLSPSSTHILPALQEQAVWCIGNIAGDTDEIRQRLVAAGAIPAVSELLFTTAESLLLCAGGGSGERTDGDDLAHRRTLTAAWALSNLSRGSTPAAAMTLNDISGRSLILLNSIVALLTRDSRDVNTPCSPAEETCLLLVILYSSFYCIFFILIHCFYLLFSVHIRYTKFAGH